MISRVASLNAKPLAKVERNGHGREQAGVIHLQRRGAGFRLHQAGQRRNRVHAGPVGIRSRRKVDVVQPRGILPVLRRNFQHHVILVELRINDRDLRLAEGAVERPIERLRGLPEARRGGAIEREHLLQSAILLVAVHVLQAGKPAHVLHQDRSPVRQVGNVFGLDRVLVLRVAAAAADAQILGRLQKSRCNRHAVHLRAAGD